MRPDDLLRELVTEILREDYGFGGGYGMYGGDYAGLGLHDTGPGANGTYGMHFADGDQLYKAFIKPFVDVVGVAAGKTKEISQRGLTLAKVAFEAVATSLLPILKDSYAEIFASEKEQLDQIRQQYGQVYKATWDAFNESDVMIAAFMYRPDIFLTTKLAAKAPKVAANLLSILTGGAADKLLKRLGISPSRQHEGILREEHDDPAERLARVINDKRIKEMIEQNHDVQAMSKQAKAIVRSTLSNVYKQASSVLNSRSLDDLQRKVGKQLPGLDKLQQVPEQERAKVEAQLLAVTKKSMKEFYVKQLEMQAQSAAKAGVPSDHPFIKDYQSVIQKIKVL